MGKRFYILNRPFIGSYGLYFAAFGSFEPGFSGAGFVLIDANFSILFAGCCQVINNSNTDVEIKAITMALHCAKMDNINISRIFVSSVELTKVLEDGTSINTWISNGAVANLQQLILQLSNYHLGCIPRN